MKKPIISLFLIVSLLFCTACGSNTGATEKEPPAFIPDITIDQIAWSVSAGTIKGENYVLCEVTNNSKFNIKSLKITFTEKQNISEKDKEAFYSDIQKSQGFDDKWMKEYVESREKQSQPISMYFRIDEDLNISETRSQVKCYYMGGWTSKNVVYPDLFTPDIATIEYEKDGVIYTLYYNFASNSYDLEEKG